MRRGSLTKLFLVGATGEQHWEWIVAQGSALLLNWSYAYVKKHLSPLLFLGRASDPIMDTAC